MIHVEYVLKVVSPDRIHQPMQSRVHRCTLHGLLVLFQLPAKGITRLGLKHHHSAVLPLLHHITFSPLPLPADVTANVHPAPSYPRTQDGLLMLLHESVKLRAVITHNEQLPIGIVL